MKIKIHAVFFSVITLLLLHCIGDFGIFPLKPSKKDPREYTWTVDTLAYPGSFQTSMSDMWASSPEDVYIVGHNSDAGGKMYHFNGREWSGVKFHVSQGGIISGAVHLVAIHGFHSEDIWAVGHRSKRNPAPPPNYLYTSLIIHFNGIQWEEYPVEGGSILQDVWGFSPQDVWAGGVDGSLFHFNGVSWGKIGMPVNYWFMSFAGFSEDDVYAIAYEVGDYGIRTYFLLHWDGTIWTLEDTFTEIIGGAYVFGRNLFIIDNQFFSAGEGIFKKTVSGWEMVYHLPRMNCRDINGSSADNLYAVGNFGGVYHYNGVDWYEFSQFACEDIHYNASWSDGYEVFIVGSDNWKTYVLHGK